MESLVATAPATVPRAARASRKVVCGCIGAGTAAVLAEPAYTGYSCRSAIKATWQTRLHAQTALATNK
jgi:hypothetical protein